MLSLLFGLSSLGWAEDTAEKSTSPELSIPFEKYELDNGLDVILSEDANDKVLWRPLFRAAHKTAAFPKSASPALAPS